MAVNDAIATLTIDNRTRANALTRSMLDALAAHLRDLDDRPDVAVVVLAGAGSHFCSGLDITEITAGRRARIVDEFIEVEDALARCSKPTIAAVQGHCIGAGAQLAIACDLRIAARTARLAITPAKLGLVYPAGSIERLVGTVGPAVTKRLLFTADMITADTALRSGLITDVVAEDEFDTAVARLAATVASRSPTTIAAAKQMTDHAASHGHVSSALHQRWRNGPDTDLAIGLAAYAAKRTPDFRTVASPTT